MSSNQDKKLQKILHFLVGNPGVSNKKITKELLIVLRTVQSVVNNLRRLVKSKGYQEAEKKKFLFYEIMLKSERCLRQKSGHFCSNFSK